MLVITILLVKTMSKQLNWPDDYRNWTGNFDELVSTAAQVIDDLGMQVGAPTTSLVRYYQQQGVVGRGCRAGRGASFSFDELSQVVMAKQMVSNQMPLAIARAVMSNASADDIYKTAAYQSYSDCDTPAVAASVVMQTNSPARGNAAEQLVAKLMSQNNLSATPSQMRPIAAATLPQAAMTTTQPQPHIPPGGVLRYALAHGVQVEIPADQNNRHMQAQALRDFADALDPQTPTTRRNT